MKAVLRTSFLLLVSVVILLGGNPFVTKFGGPYPNLGLEFKKQIVSYGGMYGSLGESALDDVEGMQSFIKKDVDPVLAAMKPAGPEEEKVKAAAVHLKTVFMAQVDPSKVAKDELVAIDKFLADGLAPEDKKDRATKLGVLIINFRQFSMGLTRAQFDKLRSQQK